MTWSLLSKSIDRPNLAMHGVVERPKSWWLPAVLLTLSAALLLWVSVPYLVDRANEQTEQTLARITASMSEEQVQAVQEASKPMTSTRLLLTSGIAMLIMMPLGWLTRGTLIHFSSMAMGGSSQWGATFAACVWAMLPFFVRDLLQIAWVLVNKGVMQHAGLSFLVATGDFLKDGQSIPYNLLAQIDPFILWHLILLTAAIAVATKVGKGKAFVLALLSWLFITALKLIPVAIGAAVMGQYGG